MVIWIIQDYLIYCYVVVMLTIISILQAAYVEYQNLSALEKLARADGLMNRWVELASMAWAWMEVVGRL